MFSRSFLRSRLLSPRSIRGGFLVLFSSAIAAFTITGTCALESQAEVPAGRFDSWKKETVGEYENRLRYFSHPFKVFNYFASVHRAGERLMTVHDLIRSLLPYRPGTENKEIVSVPSAELFFQYADINGDGLISFNEYILFLTLLGTPEYHWKIAFKLFDVNGDGTVSQNEFQRIMSQATSEYAVGHRMGTAEIGHIKTKNTGLNRVFFGKDGSKSLTFEEFNDFMQKLQLEMLKLEFNQYSPINNTISLEDFAHAMLNYVHPKMIHDYQTRLNKIPASEERISFQQYYKFDHAIRTRLHDIHLAYKLSSSFNSGFTKEEFRRVMKSVTGHEWTQGQVDVIFGLFDADENGVLQSREFYDVLKARRDRGIRNSGAKGIKSWFENVVDCVKNYDD